MLDTNEFKKYIELNKTKKQLETDLEQVKQDMVKKSKFLIDQLETNEMRNIKIAGKNCYINKIIVARISDRSEAITVLRETGFDDYIKEGINTQSISKLMRDLLEENGELPAKFYEVITPYEVESLRVKND